MIFLQPTPAAILADSWALISLRRGSLAENVLCVLSVVFEGPAPEIVLYVVIFRLFWRQYSEFYITSILKFFFGAREVGGLVARFCLI